MHANEQMSNEYMYLHLNIHNSSTRPHPPKEKDREMVGGNGAGDDGEW
jgi:hypothetical protein